MNSNSISFSVCFFIIFTINQKKISSLYVIHNKSYALFTIVYSEGICQLQIFQCVAPPHISMYTQINTTLQDVYSFPFHILY
jgi:hypothetical protein